MGVVFVLFAGICGTVGTVLLALRLADLIGWPWWVVLGPWLAPAAICGLMLVGAIAMDLTRWGRR